MSVYSLELKNITKSFGKDEDVLRGISLSIEKGELSHYLEHLDVERLPH